MFESKYSKVLTVILIIVIIAVVILLSFLGYDVYKKFATKKAVAQVLDEFNSTIANEEVINEENVEDVVPIINDEVTETTNNTAKKKVTYKGYNVVGTIEIPKISLKYPILERTTGDSIEISVAMLCGPGPNQVGNTVIVGHNYRNGSFFGKNYKLELDDKIYITDTSGNRLEYNIYNIYKTSPEDADYTNRDTNGKKEISLSTCSDNSQNRLIIWAVAQE